MSSNPVQVPLKLDTRELNKKLGILSGKNSSLIMHNMWQVIFFSFLNICRILMPKRFLNIFFIFRTVLLLTSPVWTGQFPVSRNNTNATVPATVKTEVTNRKCMPDVPPHILWTVWHKRRVRTYNGIRQRGGGDKCFIVIIEIDTQS